MVQTKGMDPEVGESMGYLKNSKLGGCEASTGAMTVVWADVMAMAVERKGQTQVHFRDRTEKAYKLGLTDEKTTEVTPTFLALNL